MNTSSEGDRSGVWKDSKMVTFHITKQQSGAQTTLKHCYSDSSRTHTPVDRRQDNRK